MIGVTYYIYSLYIYILTHVLNEKSNKAALSEVKLSSYMLLAVSCKMVYTILHLKPVMNKTKGKKCKIFISNETSG